MSALPQVKKEIEAAITAILDKYYPKHFAVQDKLLGKEVEKAAQLAVVKQALECTQGNQQAASRRTGLCRTTILKVILDNNLPKYSQLPSELVDFRQWLRSAVAESVNTPRHFRAQWGDKYEKALATARRQGYVDHG